MKPAEKKKKKRVLQTFQSCYYVHAIQHSTKMMCPYPVYDRPAKLRGRALVTGELTKHERPSLAVAM